MTAPDPELTDLIAAHYRHCVSEEIRLDPETGVHTYWIECTCVCGADTSVEVTGDREAAVRLADAAHLASVVEQHTNGQITEVNVRARATVKAANKRASIRITQIRKEEAARFEAEARAAKAEATIARVEKFAHDMRGWCSPHGISVTYSDRIFAVLEGE